MIGRLKAIGIIVACWAIGLLAATGILAIFGAYAAWRGWIIL